MENNHFIFKQIDNDLGLSQNGVLTIFQDKKGCMWFGTRYGLNRYDGFDITTFYADDAKKHLSGNSIQSMLEDDYHNIWIATNEGITLYNTLQQCFYNISYYQSNKIFAQIPLSMKYFNKKILLSYNEGIWEITPPKGIITEEDLFSLTYKRIIVPNDCNQLTIHNVDNNNNLILTTQDNSIVLASISDGILHVVEKISLDCPNVEITKLYIDKQYNIWLGTSSHGLFLIKRSKDQRSSEGLYTSKIINIEHSFLRITDIIQDNNNNIWVTSRSHGVIIIPSSSIYANQITSYKLNGVGLSTRKIKCILQSRDNTIWLGTLGSGVFTYNSNSNKFKNYRLSDNPYDSSVNYIRSIIKDSYDRLWFGTLFNGIHIYNPKNHKINKSILKDISVFDFCALDRNHMVTCSSEGLYLIKYDKNEIKTKEILSKDAVGGTIFCMTNKHNKFWIGTNNKLMSFTLTQDYQIKDIHEIPNSELSGTKIMNSIRIVKYDFQRNCLWIGTQSMGIVRVFLDHNGNINTSIESFLVDSGIKNIHVSDIELLENNICWVSTHSGLFKLTLDNDGKVEETVRFTKEDGLPSNMIQSLESDSENNLWIGTNRGLAKFNKKNYQSIIYDTKDGIQDYEFAEHASYVDDNGYIYFGGVNGVSEISSEHMSVNKFTDKVHIREIIVNGKIVSPLAIQDQKELVLSSSENNIKFHFITYNYVNPLKCLYAYKLQGYDEQWHYTTGKSKKAEYINLKSGRYTFIVKASNEDGKWEETQTIQNIKIKPLFWVTFWAFLLYVLILFVLVCTIVIVTKHKVKKKQQILYNMYYLNELNKMSQAKLQFFINISHEIRTPLTLITCSIEKLVSHLKLDNKQENEMGIIHSNINRILNLLNELIEVRKIETGNYQLNVRKENIVLLIKNIIHAFTPLVEKLNLEISLQTSSQEIILWFDLSVMEKVLCNLISNAIKYTPSHGRIHIDVFTSENEQELYIKVSDTGIGISKENINKIFDRFQNCGGNKDSYEKGFGIGLHFTKSLIEQHKGSIFVKSELGRGSCFSITLPMGENIYSAEEKAEKFFRKTDLNLVVESISSNMVTPSSITSVLPQYVDKTDSQRITILLIDDNIDILNSLCDYLSEAYNVITASNGKSGYETALTLQPDLILSDIIMPEMDGVELCHALKGDINTSHIPVILLTAKCDDETHIKSIESGADYFLSKPFNVKLLNQIIENITKSKDNVRKAYLSGERDSTEALNLNINDQLFLDKLLAYIEEHMMEPDLKINFIADAMNMSRATFYRKIKIVTGITGKEFIDSIRLKKAAQLLITRPDMSISDIAYTVGHTNPLYFSKWFKTHYKISPSEYIKQNKSELKK